MDGCARTVRPRQCGLCTFRRPVLLAECWLASLRYPVDATVHIVLAHIFSIQSVDEVMYVFSAQRCLQNGGPPPHEARRFSSCARALSAALLTVGCPRGFRYRPPAQKVTAAPHLTVELQRPVLNGVHKCKICAHFVQSAVWVIHQACRTLKPGFAPWVCRNAGWCAAPTLIQRMC